MDEDASTTRSSASQGATEAVYIPQPRIPSDVTPLVEHLQSIFERDFPPKLAKQMLTHISAKESWEGHNSRLSFIGERFLGPLALVAVFLNIFLYRRLL